MLRVLRARLHQGQRTIDFPPADPRLSDRYRGLPVLEPERCVEGCQACADACPTAAITTAPLSLDLGRCLFCTECTDACPSGAVRFTSEYRMAARSRDGLLVTDSDIRPRVGALDREARRLFGRSLRLRQVSAGGCNACEADIAVLNTVVYDLGRFGIQFVASPRHADGVVVTGAVTANMGESLRITHEAIPTPSLVIAVGACAINGGPFAGHPEVADGADALLPVDLYIPGCPPHPLTVLDGLLGLLGRID